MSQVSGKESATSAAVDAESYHTWAQSLIGRDWEIYWVDEEDNGGQAEPASVAGSGDMITNETEIPAQDNVDMEAISQIAAVVTATGQETSEEKRGGPSGLDTANNGHPTDSSHGDGKCTRESQSEASSVIQSASMDLEASHEDGINPEEDDDDGSIIDDWYDGHILKVERTDQSEAGIESSYLFHVHFVGEETIYKIALDPSKVRPSARGWVQRTVALLRPPHPAGEENNGDESGWESKLPPDTSRQEDTETLKELAIRICGAIDGEHPRGGHHGDKKEGVDSMPPSRYDFRRIQRLRYLLEAQIWLRSKLSKIETPPGEDKFTDGVRNPTEPYVNHLVQCCHDLISACDWYCNSWRLLDHFFGIDIDRSFENLTFDGLVRDFVDFGRDVLVNCALIDVNSCTSPGKRRQALSSLAMSSNRRTKRRRIQSSQNDPSWIGGDETEDLLLAASHLQRDVLSSNLADSFSNAVVGDRQFWYLVKMGNIFRELSHLVLDPLVSWKSQATMILGNTQHSSLLGSLQGKRMFRKEGTISTTKLSTAKNKRADQQIISTVDDDNSSFEESSDETISYEDIQACVASIRGNRVLARFDLDEEVHSLHAVLHDIEQAEDKARSLLGRLCEPMSQLNSSDDVISIGLKEVLDKFNAPNSPLRDVEPICRNSTGDLPIITRCDLQNAVRLRQWFIDCWRVETVRERYSLLQTSLEMVEVGTLPNLGEASCLAANPEVSHLLNNLMKRIKDLNVKIEGYDALVNQCEGILLFSISPQDSEYRNLTAHCDELRSSLSSLATSPVIFTVEEKIASRLDVIGWTMTARKMCSKIHSSEQKRISFDEAKSCYDQLVSVMRGKASTRFAIVQDTIPNDALDNEICDFVSLDLNRFCAEETNLVRKLYEESQLWIERAENVLSSLSGHGNSSAGRHVAPLKMPAMVDVKRIDDLISEYREGRVEIPGYVEDLTRIHSEALKWSDDVQGALLEENTSFAGVLTLLKVARESRPKGLIMDPTRSVMDSLIDLLSAYLEISSTFDEIRDKIQFAADESPSTCGLLLSSMIIERAYPLVADEMEVLDAYCDASVGYSEKFYGKAENSLRILESAFNIRRSARAITRERIESSSLIQTLVSRIIARDEEEGRPLQSLLWFHWHLHVADFLDILDRLQSSSSKSKNILTLGSAKDLASLQPPRFAYSNEQHSSLSHILTQFKSNELSRFGKFIAEAEEIEDFSRNLLARSKDLLKGSIHKAEESRVHLSQLKEYQNIVRARTQGLDGLSLSELLDSQLDQHIRLFSWLLKTFSYPILHQEEVRAISQSEGDSPKSSDPRIPWDALVGLYDKIPKDVDGSGDFVLCTFTVTELYNAASKWNKEITEYTLLSNRGNKRRSGKIASSEISELSPEDVDAESSSKIQMAQMELLAQDPILSRVLMPRQKALDTMIRNSRQFENQLQGFLAQDYHSAGQDKAPFPTGRSLIGHNGQFILYRLTLSPLFGIMQSSMSSLSQVAENVFAETPGKAAFDWMSSAVSWIERLHYSVIPDAQFGSPRRSMLVVPAKEARRLCSLGEDIFLQTNDDMRQTLSNHGIYVSTSAQRKKLTVALKKDGAHHSVGGTVARWCPILFDALREDCAKTELWERKASEVLKDVPFFFNSNTNYDDVDSLFQLFEFCENVRAIYDEGQQSLVVLPSKDLADSLSSILGRIEGVFDNHSSRDLNDKFSKLFSTNIPNNHENRFRLLDAVMYRRTAALASGAGEPTSEVPSMFDSEKNFRNTCRGNLEIALSKAIEQLRLDHGKRSDYRSLCVLKSWEIENEIFERFQGVTGTLRVSDGYREKARSLKSNLSVKNLSLCLRVLTGEIDPAALVKMTSDQLASQQARLDREKAKREALKDKVLTPGVKEEPSKQNEDIPVGPNKPNVPSTDKKSPASILKVARHSPAPKNGFTDTDKSHKTKPKAEMDEESYKDDADGAPTMDEYSSDDDGIPTLDATDLEGSDLTTNRMGSHLKHPLASRAIGRPAAPPSLAFGKAFQDATENEATAIAGRGVRVENVSGGDKFRIEIQASTKLAFHAAFYLENSTFESLCHYMPETLVQYGRSKIDDCQKFLIDKLKGGKWQATCIRLATISDRDASTYKNYYKEFEMKERIAMFKLGGVPGCNLFLVTPKFHSQISATGLVSFSNPTSTYGIALTKEAASVWLD